MSTISNERLEEITNDKMINQGSEFAKMATELLALRKERERAEPVAWMLTDNEFGHSVATKAGFTLNFYRSKGWGVTPLYTAPPAPVVPAETFDEWSRRCEIQLTLCRPEFREVAEITWNACRAAMLKGTEDATS